MVLELPVPVRKGRHAPWWIFGVLVFVLIGIVGYFLSALGPSASIAAMVLALIPLGIVIVGALVIDRWEPEPWSLKLFALGWGAIISVAIALLASAASSAVLGSAAGYDVFMTVGQAPIVEEIAKGLGVFLIFVIARRTFDGPVDGVVYGALVGAGFAFTENIQYFAISMIEDGAAGATVTFFLRGLLSPFAHAMFTAATGVAIGAAARRHGTVGAALGWGALGLLVAVALHMFWNGSATFGNFFALYFTLQVPLFAASLIGISRLRRREERATRDNLALYAQAGWFTPQEVVMLATPDGRKAGMAWARTLRGDRSAMMRGFIRDAAALANVRHRVVKGTDALATADERTLLERMVATRAMLLAP